MKKKLLVAVALVLCLAVCALVLFTCQGNKATACVSLDQTALTIALDGDPVTLVAMLSEGEGAFTWESSSPEVASIDQNGTVTPVSRGTTTITVRCGDLTPATCTVTVGEPLHTPVFQADAMGLGLVIALDQGQTYQIIDTVTYNGLAVEVPVRYSSADETIATVSDTGVVTAVSMGTGEITVTAQYLGIEIQMVVTVAVQSDISFTAATKQAVSLTKRPTGTCITLVDADQQIQTKPLSVQLVRTEEDASASARIQWLLAAGGDQYVCLSAYEGESATVTAVAPGETTVLATTLIDGTTYTVAFGITVEEGQYIVTHTDTGRAAGKTACDGICDVCGEKITVTHADKDKNCVCDYCGATIHTDSNFDGICDNNSAHDLRIRLTQQNAGTPALFAAIVAANANKYIILTEDLDWSGEGSADLFGDTYSQYTNVEAIANFSGVLNGQGHIISGFRLGHSGAANDTAMFLKNSGTIKNIGFSFTLATANSGQTGLVRENTGTIENVFVDVTANARSWATGTVAGISTGAVRNCIALVNEASAGKGGNFAGMVGAYRGGSIQNCYAIGNGHTTTSNAYTECFSTVSRPVYTHYAKNNTFLAAVKSLPSGSGWASSWAVTKDGITFGGKLVIAYTCDHVDSGKTAGTTACDGICDLCGEAVALAHVDTNKDCVCDYCRGTAHTDADGNGICDNNSAHDLRIRLTQQNAGTPALFAATVAANADRYLLLTEDLDWSGEGTADLFGNTGSEYTTVMAIAELTGTLDGQGHTISGFRLGHSLPNYDSTMFLTNSGTIKNIGFSFTLATANSAYTGLVRENTGTLENVFVDVTANVRSWSTGALAGISTGTVRNCISLINAASTGTGGNLSGAVGAYRDGSITNCYAIGNGHTTTANAYTECFSGLDAPSYTLYSGNNALLAAVKSLPSGSGWASCWSVTKDGITFGGKLVIKYICDHADNGSTSGSTACDGVCDLCGEDVTVAHSDSNGDCACDYCGANLHTDLNADGICDNNAAHDFRIKLTKENAGTPTLFAATVAEYAGQYLALTEDLDWSGLSTAGHIVESFTGTLDGLGHSIKGFTVGHGLVGSDYQTCLVGTNNGTIKNLALAYTMTAAAGNSSSLVAKNYGTVENLFVAASYDAYSWTTGAIVAFNYASGTVRNCITTVSSTLSSQASKNRLGSIVGADYNGKIINCYFVNTANSVTTPYIDTWGNGSYSGNVGYADSNALLAAVTSLPDANGWASVWSVSDEGIRFGGSLVIAPQTDAGCVHVDVSPADGKCDSCGEELAAPQNVYYISTTNASTLKELVDLINEDLSGTYYLTEDLDYSSSANNQNGIGAFAGVLNGQGHTIKGIKIKYNSLDSYASNLFKSNSGTIENIAFDYSIVDGNGQYNGLIGQNTGTVANVYAKASVTFFKTGQRSSAFVAHNTGAAAVVKNCIVELTLASSITSLDGSLGAVVSLNNNNAAVENCYYKVSASVTVPGIAYPWGGKNSTTALTSAVTSLPAADGWASYWSITAGSVQFG